MDHRDDSMSWKSEFTCWEKVWIPWVISDHSVLYPINTPLINIPINPLFIINEHSTPINPVISFFFPTKNDPVDVDHTQSITNPQAAEWRN